MRDALNGFRPGRTPQTEKATSEQVKNNAGGYVFKVDLEAQVRRFLVLGSSTSTYYTNAAQLTRENANAVIQLANTNHARLVELIVDVSTRGGAPKVQPALFALALASSIGSVDDRRNALAALNQVARTGSHLLTFVRFIEQFELRGWGRGLRSAVGGWYTSRPADALAYQVAKYRQRDGVAHRDVLRLSHPETLDPALKATFEWVCRQAYTEDTPNVLHGFRTVREARTAKAVADAVLAYRLSWEMVPDEWTNEAVVWDALLDVGVPMTALIRKLSHLTRIGVIGGKGSRDRTARIVEQLTDADRLVKARVHPMNVLVAQATYAAGASDRGRTKWVPSAKIVDALNDAYYLAYGAVTPAGKRTLIGLDVSGSMDHAQLAAMPLSARQAATALAMVTVATEPAVDVVAFTTGGWSAKPSLRRGHSSVLLLPLSARQRLDDVMRLVSGLPFAGTDCALPMQYATANGLEVDTFVVLTDNETYAGDQHPHEALVEYRRRSGIDARLVVVAMTSNSFSIADPNDPGMLDVVGMDTNVPELIASFSRGEF